MSEIPSSGHAIYALVDEVSRLNGRFKSAFVAARKAVGLGESEMTVLNSVVEADSPPTVPQIGRSLGIARQLIQRAANGLLAQGLIATQPNPDHKRAVLLTPTDAGREAKRRADVAGNKIVHTIECAFDLNEVERAATALQGIRKTLESCLRER